MIIENRVLFNLFQSVKRDCQAYSDNGLYIEGFSGGVTIYAKGKALYRQTVYGDNKTQFCSYISDWQKKDGKNYAENLEYMSNMDGDKTAQKIREFAKIFEAERFNAFSVNGQEFRKTVDGVDVINRSAARRERTHNIVISAHNGLLDIASWTNGEDSAVWQMESKINASGAVMVDRKHLDNIKGKTVEFACLKHNNKLGLYVKGAIEAVLPVMDIDPERFLEVLEYEYCQPEPQSKPEIKMETVTNEDKILAMSANLIQYPYGGYYCLHIDQRVRGKEFRQSIPGLTKKAVKEEADAVNKACKQQVPVVFMEQTVIAEKPLKAEKKTG